MKRIGFLTVLMVIFTFSLEGCKNSQQPQDTGQQTTSPPSENSSPAKTEDFSRPLKPGPVSVLLPPTNPNQRVNIVNRRKGRSDPFEIISVQPKIEFKPSAGSGSDGKTVSGANNTSPPASSSPKGTGQIARGPVTASPESRLGPSSAVPGGGTSSNLTPKSLSLPQLEEAKAVAVTGVMEINGVYYAIVKAPSDGYSRYVKAGDSLANGKVTIKRIQVTANGPVVILEQRGVEVARKVGDKPPAEKTDKSTALVPNSLLPDATIN